MDYTITEVLGTKENVYEGKDSVRFKVEGVEHTLSTLTKDTSAYAVGATIHGTITSKVKEDKTFYNFNEKKGSLQSSQPIGDINRVELIQRDVLVQLRTIGAEITSMKGVISSLLREKDQDDGSHF